MTTTTPITEPLSSEPSPPPAPRSGQGSADSRVLPLTAALLHAAADGVSFATPGHRAGRSCPKIR